MFAAHLRAPALLALLTASAACVPTVRTPLKQALPSVIGPDARPGLCWRETATYALPGPAQDGVVADFDRSGTVDLAAIALEPGRALAAMELAEETGVSIAAERFVAGGERQCMATLLTHRAELYSVALGAEEIAVFKARAGQRFGENESERTYVEVRTVAEILAARDVDWTHVGMILSVPGGG